VTDSAEQATRLAPGPIEPLPGQLVAQVVPSTWFAAELLDVRDPALVERRRLAVERCRDKVTHLLDPAGEHVLVREVILRRRANRVGRRQANAPLFEVPLDHPTQYPR
jgi:hypothetical protein